ncbi:MAG TPA: M48 family metallopeptidase [Thermoanaerobaculia bacterium]|nr:M48 family metallopeptidase [Thermoanaerobaculia bacterium]
MTSQKSIQARFATVVVALMLTPLMAQAQTKIKPGFNLFSPQQDVEVGQQSAQQAEQQLPVVNDARVNQWVNDIGQRLAAQAPGPKFQYRFRVVNASDINAFALPGGFVYINRGVIDAAKTEGEVAGVMAHEISHVALRHGTHQASKAYLAQAGIGILGGVLGGHVGAGAGQIINAVGGLGLNVLFLRYSREAETQADVMGAQILARSGYNPQDMINFFKTLEQSDHTKTATFLSDHPAPPDRVKRITQEAALLRIPATATRDSGQLRNIQASLRSLGSAPTSQQIASQTAPPPTNRGTMSPGQVAAPSGQMKTYTNPNGAFEIEAPSNWQVVDEGRTGVTLAPQGGAGKASNGNLEVVYGAIINHFDPDSHGSQFNSNGGSQATTIEDATSELIDTLTQSSGYLQMVRGSGSQFRVAGGKGLGAILRGTSPVTGLQERVSVVTRQLSDGHLLYLLFITPERDARSYAPVLNAMLNSLQVGNRH